MTTFGSDSPLDRRTFLGGALAAGAATFGAAPAFAAPKEAAPKVARRKAIDFADPRQNLDAYVKLTSNIAGEPVVGWYSGHVFGVVDDQILKPLFALEGFGVGQSVRQPDGTYKSSWKEVGYYKDVATNRILERWRNPYNDADCEVMHIHNRAVNSILAPAFPKLEFLGTTGDMKLEFPNYTRAGDPSLPFVLPWIVNGDTVSVWMDFRGRVKNLLDPAKWKRESTGPYIRVSEFFQNVGSLALLEDPDVTDVPATGAWNRLAPWLPWMLMGTSPGHLYYRCTTKKLKRFEELPPDVLAYTQKRYPEFLDYVTPWKLPNESTWEVYARERQPIA